MLDPADAGRESIGDRGVMVTHAAGETEMPGLILSRNQDLPLSFESGEVSLEFGNKSHILRDRSFLRPHTDKLVSGAVAKKEDIQSRDAGVLLQKVLGQGLNLHTG